MADTITSATDLKVGLKFDDADTRLISIPNPDESIDANDIRNAFTNAVANNIFIGDKTGASLTGLYTAYTEETYRRQLDLRTT